MRGSRRPPPPAGGGGAGSRPGEAGSSCREVWPPGPALNPGLAVYRLCGQGRRLPLSVPHSCFRPKGSAVRPARAVHGAPKRWPWFVDAVAGAGGACGPRQDSEAKRRCRGRCVGGGGCRGAAGRGPWHRGTGCEQRQAAPAGTLQSTCVDFRPEVRRVAGLHHGWAFFFFFHNSCFPRSF